VLFLGISIYIFVKFFSEYHISVYFFPLIFILLFIYLLVAFQFKTIFLKKIKKDIVNVNFNKKEIIKQKINDKILKFDDIFQDLNINYN